MLCALSISSLIVALPEPAALRPLFLAAAPVKVMHSCSEDLDVLKRLFGAVPGSLVDTQVAAAMLGHPLQTSYQKLLKAVLDIDVPKDIYDAEYPTEDYGTEVFSVNKGVQQMDGATALKFARGCKGRA